VGETLLAALAAAGQPCLPYPDRDRRERGVAETHPAAILKVLLWERSPLASSDRDGRERLFRSYDVPAYRRGRARGPDDWAHRAAALDLVLLALGQPEGFDLEPARRAAAVAASEAEVERAGALLDACLAAGTLRRYLEAPESCVFLGEAERGYVILPADALVRRLALGDLRKPREGRLFPRDTLEQRLGPRARLRPLELLPVPGRAVRTEATFEVRPSYEFDNLDEMLWWKHCRHLAGPQLPTEGLNELHVALGSDRDDGPPLRLVRSRHPTLSFRFEPPAAWRLSVPTRDGRTHGFSVLRAIYDITPEA
jgi:hypothetical protein